MSHKTKSWLLSTVWCAVVAAIFSPLLLSAQTVIGAAQNAPNNFTAPQVFTSYLDIGQVSPSSNPASGYCRFYYSTGGVLAAITSSGGSCMPSSAGVALLNPSGAQSITQPASGGISTIFAINNLNATRWVTPNWNWSYQDSGGSLGNLTSAGSVIITLPCSSAVPCPLGIDTSSSSKYYIYRIYISGTGTPEAVTVTGGTCTPGATSPCTLAATTLYAHPNGYKIGSASTGVQEALNDAWTTSLTYIPSLYVKLEPSVTYSVYSTVYLRGWGAVFDGSGAQLICYTRDRCVNIGDNPQHSRYHRLIGLSGESNVNVDGVQVSSVAASSGTYTVTTASTHPFLAGDTVDCEYYTPNSVQHWMSQVLSAGLTGTQFEVSFGSATFSSSSGFGFCALENTFVEDNSDHAYIDKVDIFNGLSPGNGLFTYGIVNDNDQQLNISHASNRSSTVFVSDANFPMGAYFLQRTDQGNQGIMYVHNTEIANANCITSGGNGLVFEDSVCEGYPVFGVRYFGAYQPATINNVYEDAGPVTGPFGLAMQMGYLFDGGRSANVVNSGFPVSSTTPEFATGGTATTERYYFVVPDSSAQGYGPMFYAGYAMPSSGSTNITVTWPNISPQDDTFHNTLGTVTWDILAVVGTSAVTPYGTGNFAVATGVTATCGTNGICTYVDTQPALSSYTVHTQAFVPQLWFWPNNMVIGNSQVKMEFSYYDPQAVAALGTTSVSIIATQCVPGGAPATRTPIKIYCGSANTNGANLFATIYNQTDASSNGPPANSKGRLNLGQQIGLLPNDLITLGDSNTAKTLATYGSRPSNDAGDMAIGIDQSGGYSVRAATSISAYIDTVNDNASYLERLTSSGKTEKVPFFPESTVVGSLPSASANAGAIMYVTDSTSIATEGQTCVGSSSNKALAFSNGSVWKCF